MIKTIGSCPLKSIVYYIQITDIACDGPLTTATLPAVTVAFFPHIHQHAASITNHL